MMQADDHLVDDTDKVRIVEVHETYGSDFYVYQGLKLVRVCPSPGMAAEMAAGI